MITGARQGTLTGLRRLTAAAMARDLCTFVIPGPEIARAHGLDLEAAGLRMVASPRHASVLLVMGNISAQLRDAATIVYAQMVRPRTVLLLGNEELPPLPAADVLSELSQQGLVEGVRQLRDIFSKNAFQPKVQDFDAPMLHVRIEYVCPMHPEVVQDEPGNCPKCGMDLVPRETQATAGHEHSHKVKATPQNVMKASSSHSHMTHEHHHKKDDTEVDYTCPMHPEVVQKGPGSCPKCGMHLVPLSEGKSEEKHSCCQNKEDKEEHDHKHHHMSHEHHKAEDTEVDYTCPMHPEVVQKGPGSCPKCGMFLVPLSEGKSEEKHSCCQNEEDKEEHDHKHHHMSHEHHKAEDTEVDYTCPMHPEVVQKGPGPCPKCGMHLVPLSEGKSEVKHSCCQDKEDKEQHDHKHHHISHEHHKAEGTEVDYTCPMHPEVVQKGPGSCPQCGMFLVPKGGKAEEDNGHDHSKMGHAGMDHGDMDFMSMIDVTKDLPRSGDGLPMEWIEAPFGPFFPGLASGLMLTFTLDGDTIAKSKISAGTGDKSLLPAPPTGAAHFVEHLSQQEPLAPVAYRLLACKTLENAAGIEVPDDIARARAGALERERLASHLNWLALFGQQTGFNWLMRRAATLQLSIQQASVPEIILQRPALEALIRRLYKTPLLKARMAGIGRLAPDATLRGPVARAAGIGEDARSLDKTWTALGFVPTGRTQSDALARLYVRLDEILQSLTLIEEAGAIAIPELININEVTAKGEAKIETARGLARLTVTLKEGKVVAAELETPSTHHLGLIEPLCDQQELGDALVAIGSLDLSPWEIHP